MTTSVGAEKAPRRSRRSPAVTAARWATGLALALAVIGVAALTVGTFTGWMSVQTVPTGSMEPAIHQGSAIAVDPIPIDEVRIGDVIVFAAPETGTMTVHRVVDIDVGEAGPVFTTKGDANEAPDPWSLVVQGDQVHKVRFAVPIIGRLLLFISTPLARLALAGAGAAVALGFGLGHLWRRQPPGPSAAHSTWGAALDRVADAGAETTRSDDGSMRAAPAIALLAPPGSPAASNPGAGDLETSLSRVAADHHPGTTGPPEGNRRARRGAAAAATALTVALVVVGIGAWLPLPTAHASFTASATASGTISSGAMLTPTSVSCSWAVATAVTVSWTNPPANAGGTTQALSATTSGGATSVAATSAVDATTVQVTPAAPLTTVRYLSTKAVRGTWSSSTSAEMPTNFCIGAVRLTAGTGTVGFSGDGGAATAAALNTPYQTAQAADGRIFIADSANNRIRVITTGGTISTFAGGVTASACTYSGPVSGLGLNAPRGVAVDTSGNVYIADTGAACIRKVDTTGTVTRFAGGGATTTCTAGAVGPTTLSLSSPSGLAVDSTGALIVADTGRNCVRKMTAATATAVAGGGATTTCGSTTSTGVSLSAPIGVAVDSANNIYIADTGRSCVRKVVGTSVTAVAGGGATTTCGTTTSTAVSLSAPQGVAVAADGSVLIADTGRRCIRRATGTAISLVAFTGTNTSTGDNGPALGATVQTPSSVAVLANGDLLVADRAITAGASDVRRIDLS